MQEPVAWMWRKVNSEDKGVYFFDPRKHIDMSNPDYTWHPLYLHPSAPERKLMSDDKKKELVGNWFADGWATRAALGMLDDYESLAAPATAPDELERLRILAELMKEGLDAVEVLIDNSNGVAGLHQNGDIASWSELRTGGRFEAWLLAFDDAREAAMKGTP